MSPYTKQTLPEGQKDDGLDSKELEYWVVRSEKFLRGKVEQKQCIESKANADVVHHRDIEITSLHSATQYTL